MHFSPFPWVLQACSPHRLLSDHPNRTGYEVLIMQ